MSTTDARPGSRLLNLAELSFRSALGEASLLPELGTSNHNDHDLMEYSLRLSRDV